MTSSIKTQGGFSHTGRTTQQLTEDYSEISIVYVTDWFMLYGVLRLNWQQRKMKDKLILKESGSSQCHTHFDWPHDCPILRARSRWFRARAWWPAYSVNPVKSSSPMASGSLSIKMKKVEVDFSWIRCLPAERLCWCYWLMADEWLFWDWRCSEASLAFSLTCICWVRG